MTFSGHDPLQKFLSLRKPCVSQGLCFSGLAKKIETFATSLELLTLKARKACRASPAKINVVLPA